ncbi:MAG: hypothetical protein FWB93_00905 [Oscillospiraceae bacterium]|nr:hypothetical protein [Oscillospiraceae bacterium]
MTGSSSQQTAEMRERAMIDHNAGLEGAPSISHPDIKIKPIHLTST